MLFLISFLEFFLSFYVRKKSIDTKIQFLDYREFYVTYTKNKQFNIYIYDRDL